MSLTDKHVALLRIAAARHDAHLVPPERLVGAARHRMAARLLELGVAERMRVEAGPLQWFRTEPDDATGLRLTQAGRAAARDLGTLDAPVRAAAPDEIAAISAPVRVPRPGSKTALLIRLMGREDGASVAEMSATLGWQAHTLRAALTRLRQGGVPVERVVVAGSSVYRVAVTASDYAAAADEAVDAREQLA